MAEIVRNERGFTLVEVLVALVILSIGLLGLAGLQTLSLSGSTDSSLRSQATLYVYDMIDRMRANRSEATNMIDQNYEINFGAVPANSLPVLVKQDLDGWLAVLATLPSGQGAVVLTSSAGQVRTKVSARWLEHGEQVSVEVDTLL